MIYSAATSYTPGSDIIYSAPTRYSPPYVIYFATAWYILPLYDILPHYMIDPAITWYTPFYMIHATFRHDIFCSYMILPTLLRLMIYFATTWYTQSLHDTSCSYDILHHCLILSALTWYTRPLHDRSNHYMIYSTTWYISPLHDIQDRFYPYMTRSSSTG